MDHGAARDRMLSAFDAALTAADPAAAARHALQTRTLPPRIRVIALGKAAPAMTRGALEVVGDRIVDVVVVSDHVEPLPDGVELMLGAHPAPTEVSVAAGRRLLQAISLPGADLVVVLVSGGGSSLAEVPAPPLTVDDVAAIADLLTRAGAPIGDLNTVRRHLSVLKNGGLLRAANGPVLSLLIDDVAGGPPSAIASGPTLADSSRPGDALAILRKWSVPASPAVLEVLGRTESDVGGHPPHEWEVVADGAAAARAAADALDAPVLTTELHGSAEAAVHRWLTEAPPGFSVLAGETTVTVTGGGRGGRNQHAALVAASTLAGGADVFGAFGTDGIDGPTDAAGAIVDGTTAAALESVGVDPETAIRRCDSHPALDAVGALVRTGPTGTNVGDLWIVYRGE